MTFTTATAAHSPSRDDLELLPDSHPIAGPRQRQQPLLAAHRAPAARTLLDIIESVACAHPDAPALDAGTDVLTYRELTAAASKISTELQRHGIGAGDRVGIRMTSGTADLYVSILGILTAGAAYVPVDADDPPDRATLVFGEAGVAGVITDSGFEPAPHRAVPDRRGSGRAPQPADEAWIIFTSGSTGVPKGVAVTHRSAAAFADAEARLFLQERPLGPGDRVLAGLSVAFDASCEEMWLAWRSGACLVPAPRSLVRSGSELGPWLVERQLTVVSTVPTLAALWPPESLDAVRLLIFGGEACPPELVTRLHSPGREMWNTYGPTEATVVACAAPLTPGEPIRIGLPLDGWDLAVIGTDGAPVRSGEVGELVIGGVGLARYLDADKDRAKYAPLPQLGWARAYRSGDLVRYEPEGLLFLGRADDQVKIGGRRVELGEIDALLQDLPGVIAAAATIQRTNSGSPVLVGYLATGGADFDTSAARAQLAENLPAALVPRLAVLEELPIRTSGKVDRHALPWPLPSVEHTAPTGLTETESWLAALWNDTLGADVSDGDADFFELGGSSLTAAQLVSRLRARHPGMTVAQLYDHHRLCDLAAHLEQAEPAPSAAARTVTPQSRISQAAQTVLLAVPLALTGAQWATWAALLSTLGALLSPVSWLPTVPAPLLAVLTVLLLTPPGRIALTALIARALLSRIQPGTHPRGGAAHLRIWLAERVADAVGATGLSCAPWMTWYARALGAQVGKRVSLHTIPPVTGMLEVGNGAAIEPETDLSGYWVDGDVVHVGRIFVGTRSAVGARSVLLPGARVGKDARVEPGSAVSGRIPAGERWAGSPAARLGRADEWWPRSAPPAARRWVPIYGLTAIGLASLPFIALVPALLILAALLSPTAGPSDALIPFLLWIPLGAILSAVIFAALVVACMRLLAIGLAPGTYPVRSRSGWQAWASERLADAARTFLFPVYASTLTPAWLRLLGAKVGRNVEASTVLLLPKFTTIADGAFLADDTLVAGYELGNGWVNIGTAKVGKRAFLGNSGMAGPGRKVPKNGLVAVLSAAPENAKRGSSWLGSPPVKLRRRKAEAKTERRTFAPPLRLRALRATVELGRVIPVTVTFGLGAALVGGLIATTASYGFTAALAASTGLAAIAAALAAIVTICAKWLLVGRIRAHETPLWSGFVWRNELADTFTEVLAAPWYARICSGSPALNLWLRGMGAQVGRGCWCETYWLPEADLVSIGSGATVNRGSVVQTHLFHDRVMSVGPVEIGAGATLGSHSVILPASAIGSGATLGPASLLMRGDMVPPGTRWQGNPIAPWETERRD
ncbi:amino acid adenylation domain-containing protein [Hoyosella sp. YIM 151337]|uniref:Pls/PosA family non-ribosomal peptide synthetase n=1 Tax=Hoyosella sp. YIM 151337 TaxID=2992742 RepID=UPI00223559A9|nr:Pls/PosA family non-ribosomal peptide synthetase [Hoyosella sp. YIM 151337]MCW4352747.1 amino acid adenylation domain-containing protein [Hoyosella sp. YIM 151337]